jgi:hypothetical protein
MARGYILNPLFRHSPTDWRDGKNQGCELLAGIYWKEKEMSIFYRSAVSTPGPLFGLRSLLREFRAF